MFTNHYPNRIQHQNDPSFIEDAATGNETWFNEGLAEIEMDDDENNLPSLESITPSTASRTQRSATPEDEKLDWGEDKL